MSMSVLIWNDDMSLHFVHDDCSVCLALSSGIVDDRVSENLTTELIDNENLNKILDEFFSEPTNVETHSETNNIKQLTESSVDSSADASASNESNLTVSTNILNERNTVKIDHEQLSLWKINENRNSTNETFKPITPTKLAKFLKVYTVYIIGRETHLDADKGQYVPENNFRILSNAFTPKIKICTGNEQDLNIHPDYKLLDNQTPVDSRLIPVDEYNSTFMFNIIKLTGKESVTNFISNQTQPIPSSFASSEEVHTISSQESDSSPDDDSSTDDHCAESSTHVKRSYQKETHERTESPEQKIQKTDIVDTAFDVNQLKTK
ncbi:unnamed protein product [Rotaria sordida]|uniref:Uncharacterized protein n=1 Tax=Rotaria sordida TaxID=392033 RepID=A0A819GNK5_9BILA|nr:unnamed protein product [Rotaria sordida]